MQKRFELGRESLILRGKNCERGHVVHNLLLETVAAVSWELKSLRSGRGETGIALRKPLAALCRVVLGLNLGKVKSRSLFPSLVRNN